MRRFAVLAVVLSLSSCDGKPPHYLVLCDELDGNGWKLTDVREENGYILACTYTSQDMEQSYTRACDAEGCNIQ